MHADNLCRTAGGHMKMPGEPADGGCGRWATISPVTSTVPVATTMFAAILDVFVPLSPIARVLLCKGQPARGGKEYRPLSRMIQRELEEERYHLFGYYHFTIHDPKVREIYVLHYRDRIVQHSLCDNRIAPFMEKHLIYDNAACRKGKGTLF